MKKHISCLLSRGFLLKAQKKLKKLCSNELNFCLLFSLLFYFSLSFSINNKTLMVFLFIFFIVFWLKLKDKALSLFLIFVLSMPFIKGKSFNFPLTSFFQGGKQFIYGYNFDLTFSDLAFFGIIFFLLRDSIRQRKWPNFRFEKNDFFLLGFIFFVFLANCLSLFPLVSFLSFFKFLRAIGTYLLIKILWRREKFKELIKAPLLALVIFEGVWASLQFLFRRPLGRSIESLSEFTIYGMTASEDTNFFRAQGTFDHPNSLGSFLVCFLIFIFIQLLDSHKELFFKKLLYAGMILGGMALIFSGSRASWGSLGILVLTVLFILFKRGWRPSVSKRQAIYFLAVAVILSLLVIFPRISHFYTKLYLGEGSTYRVYLSQKAALISQRSPFGIGLSAFPPLLMTKFGFSSWPASVHNLFMEVLVEGGFLSLTFFLIFLIFSYQKYFKIKNPSFLNQSGFWASLGFLLTANFYPTLSSNLFQYLWLFFAIMLY